MSRPPGTATSHTCHMPPRSCSCLTDGGGNPGRPSVLTTPHGKRRRRDFNPGLSGTKDHHFQCQSSRSKR